MFCFCPASSMPGDAARKQPSPTALYQSIALLQGQLFRESTFLLRVNRASEITLVSMSTAGESLHPSWRDVERVVIGMLHLPPLPGAPRARLNMNEIRATVQRDAVALAQGGVHGLMM